MAGSAFPRVTYNESKPTATNILVADLDTSSWPSRRNRCLRHTITLRRLFVDELIRSLYEAAWYTLILSKRAVQALKCTHKPRLKFLDSPKP